MYPSWPQPRAAPLNLARERLLLDECLRRREARLYTWTSWPSLVVGRLSRAGLDYNCEEARKRGIPVIRRHSGGGPVLHGPGVLAVSIIIPTNGRVPPSSVYASGLTIITRALGLTGIKAEVANEGDIVVEGYKVGGSAALIRHNGYLYHAIITVDEPLNGIEKLTPPRRDKIEKGEVDPVKYKPKPLAELYDINRKSVLRALIEVANRNGIRHYSLHSIDDPCVRDSIGMLTSIASSYAETTREACPSTTR